MEKLVEIKRGQTGTGLLIENDGYISLNEGKNKQILESYKRLNEEDGNGDFHCPYPFVVSAVFQKYGIENANGRIYPESVLRREVEKYRDKILEHRAIGECYTPNVMVLTNDGWKPISDVHEGDEVLTLNVETQEIEIQKVSKKISYTYKGDMIRIKSRLMNDLVTPNHGFPVINRCGKFKGFYTAQNIFDRSISDMNHSFIPRRGKWVEKGDDFFILKGLKNPTPNCLKKHPDAGEDKAIPMSTFMKFLGIYLSGGDYRKNNNDVNIYQKKESVIGDITELMSEMELQYTIYKTKTGTVVFRFCDPRLNAFVRPLGDAYTKYIPSYFKKQSKENLTILYDWFVKGDGRIRGDKRLRKKSGMSDDVFSASKQLALDLNEIQLKIGYSGSFHIENRKDRYIGDRLIKEENTSPLYFSYRSLTNGNYLDIRHLETTKEDYNGEVMCIEVPNHTFYVMDNGFCHWSKNCNHPSESVIDLSRVCMNILELHWEGHTLVGDMEVLTSPGFRKTGVISCQGDQIANLLLSGIKIGVSSRGLGSVTNKMGVLYVGDDYEIVCWDVVSDPSTPNAWITEKGKIPTIYIENNIPKGKNKINEKIEKASEIINLW